jgi:hypothetical protein
MLLPDTTWKVQVVTTTTANVDVYAWWADLAAGAVTVGADITKISTAATTDVVPVPGSSVERRVKEVFIANVHASAANVVTLQITDGTDTSLIESVTLLAGERIAYRDGVGTRVIDANGQEKTNASAAVYVARLAADQSNSTTTPTNVAGLEVPCGVGTWIFEYFLIYQAAATSTGVKFSVNHDGTTGAFAAWRVFPDATATAATAAPDQDQVSATGSVLDVFAARAKSTAGWGTTISVDTANADMLEMIQGIIVVSVAGNIELWHGSEVAAASTVKAGSALRLTKVG